MKKFSHLLIKSSILVLFLILPLSLKANTLDDLRNQFITLGGSSNGFNEIIKVVQHAQNSSAQLKDKINNIYNKKMFDAMVSPTFDPTAYKQIYNDLEQEKNQLAAQNLNSMIVLLQKLTLKDRQAYAQLLYGVDNTLPAVDSTQPPAALTQQPATDSNMNSNNVNGNNNTMTNNVVGNTPQ